MIFWDDSSLTSYTNLASNAAGTTITWTGGTETKWHWRNRFLHITAGTGWTVGWYRIVSINGVRSITIDRSAGANKTNGSGHVEYSQLTIEDHPSDCTLTNIKNVFDTTVASHPAATTINTNKKINLTLTDLASDATGLLISSATGGFLSDMVGMKFKVTAGTGWTVGEVTIVTFIDTNNIVIDKSLGTNKTNGTGNIPFTLPPFGNIFITAVATGKGEKIPYSSYQNDGTGYVQFTVAAPLQTFAAGDVVNLWEVLYIVSDEYHTSNVNWRFETDASTLPVETVNGRFIMTGLETVKQLNACSVQLHQTVQKGVSSVFQMGTEDTSGELKHYPDRCRWIFTPDATGTTGFWSDPDHGGLVLLYNSDIICSDAGQWINGMDIRALTMKVVKSTLHRLGAIPGCTAWWYERVNLTGVAGLLSAPNSTWSNGKSTYMYDVFIDQNFQYMCDTTYGTSDPTIVFQNAPIPAIVQEGLPRRWYLTNMNTGMGLMGIWHDIPILFDDDAFYGHGTNSKIWRNFQGYSRRIKVIDVNGNPIAGATVRFTDTTGEWFDETYTTDANGYANSGNILTVSLGYGSGGIYYDVPCFWKVWVITMTGLLPAVPIVNIITTDPYTIRVSKAGYEDFYGLHYVGVTDSHLKTEIIVKLHASASVGRDAMGGEFR